MEPTTYFKLTFEFELRGTNVTLPFSLNSVIDADNSFVCQHQVSNGNWFFQIRIAGVTESVRANEALVIGTLYRVVLTVDSVNGIKIQVNATSSTFNASRTSSAVDSTMQILNNVPMTAPMNGIASTILLEPLT